MRQSGKGGSNGWVLSTDTAGKEYYGACELTTLSIVNYVDIACLSSVNRSTGETSFTEPDEGFTTDTPDDIDALSRWLKFW
jgi:hypothetical protein